MDNLNLCEIKNDQVSNWSTSDWPDKSTIAVTNDVVTPKDTVKSYHAPGIVKAQLSHFPTFSLPSIEHSRNKSTYFRIDNSIICSIQLGIHQSINRVDQQPERDLLIQDFQSFENTVFPQSGSETTSKHEYPDFRFSVVAPTAFRHFRNSFQIRSADYVKSICSQPLAPLSNPGSSGSILYRTGDDRFILKSVQKREAIFLMRLLPGYFLNIIQNPQTLLPKFFGMYAYSSRLRKIRFIVMNNLIPSNIDIDVRYDLKGSSHNRIASDYERSKQNPTLKDLDFLTRFNGNNINKDTIWLQPQTHKALLDTMEKDCRVLESFSIMDYSLLMGIHECSGRATHVDPPNSGDAKVLTGFLTSMGSIAANIPNRNISDDRQSSTSLENLVISASNRQTAQISDYDSSLYGGIPAYTSSGDQLFIFIGIIDILQSYNTRKRMEHMLKSVLNDPYTISVIDPRAYAARFFKFMSEVVFRPISDNISTVIEQNLKRHIHKMNNKQNSKVTHKYIENDNDRIPVRLKYANISNSLRSAKHYCIPITFSPTIISTSEHKQIENAITTVKSNDQSRICILSTQL